MEWDAYWSELLEKHHLCDIISALEEVEQEVKGDRYFTKNICKGIYDNYDDLTKKLSVVKSTVENKIKTIPDIHLSTSRVKGRDSLIVKIIKKRSRYVIGDSKYSNMQLDSVKDAVTDLIGLKFIINYRGKWINIHKEIIKIFTLLDNDEYIDNEPLPHRDKPFIAERPRAYYAKGDNIKPYEEENIETKQHTAGYRSIHYILSIDDTYVELQVRTIYDEAWSDCDHNYVYKQEANPNNKALKELSMMLCKLTNAANDIGDMMHEIYHQKSFSKIKAEDDKWIVGESYKHTIQSIKDNLNDAVERFNCFDEKLETERKGD